MSYLDIKPLHYAISVPDLGASRRWYEEMLGFTFVKNVDIPALPCKIAFLRKGDFELEIFEHREPLPMDDARKHPNTDNQTAGNKHMAFYCPDVRALADALKSKGVEIIVGPQPVEDTCMCFIRDNSGIIIEFIGPLAV